MSEIVFKVKRVRPGAIVPRRQTEGASGYDLHALFDVDAKLCLRPLDRVKIGTGIALEIPPGYEAQVRPRSGNGLRGLVPVPGTVDSDYRGEVSVTLMYLASPEEEPRYICSGDRIAQLVFAPVTLPVLEEVERLRETARGAGGFGSTDRQTWGAK